jgi:NAD(P)H-dependent flavin oxidoreductase YrpB (nitropropane dioxygenase family)
MDVDDFNKFRAICGGWRIGNAKRETCRGIMFKGLKPIMYHGREVWPLVEGGKGVSATNHASSGAWAAAGGIGTVSAVNADSYDPTGKILPQVFLTKTRRERHEELIQYGIRGAVEQVKRAYEIASGKGAININVLWEMGGAQQILHGILEQTKGMVHGVTCGAGMPYKLSEIAAQYGVSYLPIVSSGRAFRALWKRAYSKVADLLAAVVYEDPWLAGGHNGLSNAEDPLKPEDPYPRVKALRDVMREGGIPDSTPIVMAGGVWYLRDWNDWIDNPELGQIAFQFGTRPLLTQESPIPQAWKERLMTLEPGDVLLHRFSPTGFYSSAVRNPFLRNLEARSQRQIAYGREEGGDLTHQLDVGVKGKNFWVSRDDLMRAREYYGAGFTEALRTPDDTLIFVTPEERKLIQKDQADCMGCLSHCAFSSWKDHDDYTTGYLADPRSFCIQKTLQDIAHDGDVEQNLMFAGHNAYNFKKDPFYSNGFVPTVKQLVDRILTGD